MIQAYLNFNGNTREAIQFYTQVFDTPEVKILPFGNNPHLPAGMSDKVMHARMDIGSSALLFSDALSTDPVTFGDNITLMLSSKDPEDIKRWFARLRVNAEVTAELESTFFSPLYGNLKDQFGILWQFYLENEHGE